MSKWIYLLLLWLAAPLQAQQPAGTESEIRFRAVDIFVDSATNSLAAYQLEFSATNGNAKIIGIEGGEHPAFLKPPHYDPKAMEHDRVVIAAFSLNPAERLPTGKTRVATVHLAISGPNDPQYKLALTTAAKWDGTSIPTVATAVIKAQK